MSETLGWIAAGLTVAAFLCARPAALRLRALSANVAFIAYGASAGLWPVLGLHAVLLPINLMRLLQAWAYAPAGRDPLAVHASGDATARPLAATKESTP